MDDQMLRKMGFNPSKSRITENEMLQKQSQGTESREELKKDRGKDKETSISENSGSSAPRLAGGVSLSFVPLDDLSPEVFFSSFSSFSSCSTFPFPSFSLPSFFPFPLHSSPAFPYVLS